MVFVNQGKQAIFIVNKRSPVLWNSEGGSRVATVLRRTIEPRLETDLKKEISATAVAFLVERQILIPAESPPGAVAPPAPRRLFKHLVVGLTGAVGVVDLIPTLHHWFASCCERFDVVMTTAAQRFIRPEMLSSLGYEVWTDPFEVRGCANVPHIHLARSADLVVVIPASAHTIHKLATGACSDLISLIVSATTAPVVLVPSMNRAMWEHWAVVQNLEQLRANGVFIIEPTTGVEVANRRDLRPEFGPIPSDTGLLTSALAAIAKLSTKRADGASRASGAEDTTNGHPGSGAP
jgi:phosphopantothenoylcysteine decarboxylase/phosphopantothenate--cysteine ligase